MGRSRKAAISRAAASSDGVSPRETAARSARMVASVMRLARAERGRVYADRVKAMQT